MVKRTVVCVCAVLMIVLQQDFWLRDNPGLIAGIIPVGLAWHAGISLGSVCVWYLIVSWCWPQGSENGIEEESHRNKGRSR